jgi:hypothetical protein
MSFGRLSKLSSKDIAEEIFFLKNTKRKGYPKGHKRAGEREGMWGKTFNFFLKDILRKNKNVAVLDLVIKERETKTTINKKVLLRRVHKWTTPRFLILPVEKEKHFFSYLLDIELKLIHRVDLISSPSQGGISDNALMRVLGKTWSVVQGLPESARDGWRCGDCGHFVLYHVNRIVNNEKVSVVSEKWTQEFRQKMGEFLEGTRDDWI